MRDRALPSADEAGVFCNRVSNQFLRARCTRSAFETSGEGRYVVAIEGLEGETKEEEENIRDVRGGRELTDCVNRRVG